MELKATLKVISEKDHPGSRGVTDGQTYQRLIGWPEVQETDRVRVGRATYKPGTYEQLHWHPIEACYYVISGHATVRNFEGEEFEVGPGSIIYAPPGIGTARPSRTATTPSRLAQPDRTRVITCRVRAVTRR